ncbi:MAG: glycoside hydrolase family 28 protein [Verrucomicrobiia bacterium]
MKTVNDSMRWKTVFRSILCVLLSWACLPISSGWAADATALAANASSKVFNVREFGAKGDGKTLDTAAIQKALDECGKTGGTVQFPPGTYLSQPIVLHSSTTLKLDAGAVLQATGDQLAFLKSGTNWLAAKFSDFIPFIGGKDLTDVTITGGGMIDGAGANWWGPAEAARRKTPGYTLPRPRLIIITGCKNLLVSDVTLQNGPCMHLVPTDCENVIISNVTVQSPAHSPNTDAIDPTNCKNMLITKCRLDVGDDDVAIKANHNVDGRDFSCEDITVTDCTFLHGHGMSIGSETSAGVHNVLVTNCTFQDTENGIRIKSDRRRGGLVENIHYTDITMKNVDPAITLTCYYMNNSSGDPTKLSPPKVDPAQAKTERTPIFRNIYFNNVNATCSESAGIIIGLPESAISNVVLENVQIAAATTGLSVKNAKGIQFKNVQITNKEGPPLLTEDAEVLGWKDPAQK